LLLGVLVRFPIVLLAVTTAGAVLLSAGDPPTPADGSAVQRVPAAPEQRTAVSPQPPEHAATGNLDKVDVPAMQIVVTTTSGKLTFHVQKDATIRQGTRTLTPAELARHKGERVKVRYRETAGEKHTFLITLAAPATKKAT
jgi:hypothetical protein